MTATTADLLAEKAPAATARARQERRTDVSLKVLASTYLRDACTDTSGERPALRDVAAAVDAALARQTTFKDLEQYRQPMPDALKGWSWRFPNGRFVSVIPDHRSPARFELLSSDRTDGPHGDGLSTGLTTDQVEALLVDIATRTR